MRIPPKRWVSPFGHPRIKACLSAPRGLSQTYTSFIAFCRQGIHRVRLVTWSYNPKLFRRHFPDFCVGAIARVGHVLKYAPSPRSSSALNSKKWLERAPESPWKMLYKHLPGSTAAHHFWLSNSEVRLSSPGLTPTNLNTTIQIRFADTVLCSFRIESRG